MRLSKSTKILEIYSMDENKVVFVQEVEENPGRYAHSTIILIDLWRELGSPTELTVTIQPGDLLND